MGVPQFPARPDRWPGRHARRRDAALERAGLCPGVRPLAVGPGGAITLGNVILHTGHDLGISCRTYAHQAGWGVEPLIRLDDHERAHVYQYMVLGPLYLPVYLLCGGVSARNPFERAADHFARFGYGWWP